MEGRRRLWGREERWIKHYSSAHEILLVGEGDFSFSTSLAVAFGSATNIFATSLDSYGIRPFHRSLRFLNLGEFCVFFYLGREI